MRGGVQPVVQKMCQEPLCMGRLRFHRDQSITFLLLLNGSKRCTHSPPAETRAQFSHGVFRAGGCYRFEQIDPLEVLLVDSGIVGLYAEHAAGGPTGYKLRTRGSPQKIRLVAARNLSAESPEAIKDGMMFLAHVK